MTKQSMKMAKCVGLVALHTDYPKLWQKHTRDCVNGLTAFQSIVRRVINNAPFNNLGTCRCCKKFAMRKTDTNECEECSEFLLYTHYDINDFKWWKEHMDKDFSDDEGLEMIEFRARVNIITSSSRFCQLEWYYGYEPKKKYTLLFSTGSPFWIEFCETYCKCYDDDDY